MDKISTNVNDRSDESLKGLLAQIARRLDALEDNKAENEMSKRMHDLESRLAQLELLQGTPQPFLPREVVNSSDLSILQLNELRDSVSKEIEGIKGRLDGVMKEIEALKAAKSNLETTQLIQDEVSSIKSRIAELDKSLTGDKAPSSPAEGDLERIWIRGYGYTEARLFPLGRSINKSEEER